MKRIVYLLLIINVITMWLSFRANAQGQDKYIQFSGFVIDSKTEEALPGAFIKIENAGRGTITNAKGYFILNVFPGDSIVFSYIGFSKQFHIIPDNVGLNYSAVVELQEDAKLLKEVQVYPFRTEDEFKKALIAMELPDDQERKILRETFSQESINRMVAIQGMSADANYRYAMNQQLAKIQSQGQVTVNPLTNPFAWLNFINTVKNGALKDKSWKDRYQNINKTEKGSRDNIFKYGGN